MSEHVFQRCIYPHCAATASVDDASFQCPRCGGLMDVAYDWDRCRPPRSLRDFEAKWSDRANPLSFSGVWRFHELLPFAPPEAILTIGEGQTLLQQADALARVVGLAPGHLFLQYEGMNPSGSFKDNGMSAAFTHARLTGARRTACASTGNTSASLALFCAASGLMKAVVFIGSGKIAYGKLAQAIDHGALTVQIAGDFDDAMRQVRQVAKRLGLYLVNSINPFRLEGQKTIMYRVLEALRWQAPDWIVVPGGNLGNVSAFGKAFAELRELGLLKESPRLAVINAAGARTFDELHTRRQLRWNHGQPDQAAIDGYYRDLHDKASTIASAIEINQPVNLPKALRALEWCDGIVRTASDQEILDAKALVGAHGYGCEPASAASVAGAMRLRREGIIAPHERVVCILTGNVMKDPNTTLAYHNADAGVLAHHGIGQPTYANRAIQVPNELEAIVEAIERHS